MSDFGIKEGYKSRLKPRYFDDIHGEIIWQPDVYKSAIKIAKSLNLKHIIDIGSGNGLKLKPFEEDFDFVFIDFGDNLKNIRSNMLYPEKHKFINQNFEHSFPKLDKAILSDSVVICSDVIEHIVKPNSLAKGLKYCMSIAPFVIISTPDRLRTRGIDDYGPPDNKAHVREWSLEELNWYIQTDIGANKLLSGYTRSNDFDHNRNTIVILGGKLFDDIMSTKPLKASIGIDASGNNITEHVNLYLNQQGLLGELSKGILLPEIGFLASPQSAALPLAKILNHAIGENYSHVKVQRYATSIGSLKAYPDMTVAFKRHGNIVEYLGSMEMEIKKGAKRKVYPINLSLFTTAKKSYFNKAVLGKRLIDSGHLDDDYLLESLVGLDV